MLSKQDKANLEKINKILKESFGFTKDITNKLSKSALVELRKKAQDNMTRIVESSEFNSYHKIPEYNQSMLVIEAVNILTNKKSTQSELDEILSKAHNESRVKTSADTLYELKNMYESYVAKHGVNDKAKKMAEKIQAMEKKVYNESISSKLNILLKEDADKAEAIMSARGLLDDLIGYQAKIGEIQNKYIDPFIEMVRSEFSNEMADDMYEKMNSSLSDLLAQVRDTKEVFANVVAVLSGDAEMDSMVADEKGDMESDELADFGDEESPEESEEGSVEALDDLGLGDEENSEESEEGSGEEEFDLGDEFKRREE
jgi:hypothetical protein